MRKSALSLIKLFDENQEYADLEIFEEYLKIKSMYEIDYQKFGYTDKNNPNNESCNIFDENF